jgi:hypothetical protein
MGRKKQERYCSPAGLFSGEATLEVIDGDVSMVGDSVGDENGVRTTTVDSRV